MHPDSHLLQENSVSLPFLPPAPLIPVLCHQARTSCVPPSPRRLTLFAFLGLKLVPGIC